MQFIEELTLMYKVAIGAGVIAIVVLLALLAKRRSAATAPVAAAATPETPPVAAPVAETADAPAKKRRTGRKSEAGVPRRKRRKLAAEAAHLGLELPQPLEFDVPAVPAVPPAPLPEPIPAELFDDDPADAPALEPIAPEPIIVAGPKIAANDDPYVHGAPLNFHFDDLVDAPNEVVAPAPVVAQPGWPAPGELSTSFDPDAFDPTPEHNGHRYDDEAATATFETIEDDDTDTLEVAPVSTTHEVAALEEIEEWSDSFDDESEDWDIPATAVAAQPAWSISDATSVDIEAVTVDDTGDLEDLWSEPDDEPLWSAPAEDATPAGPTAVDDAAEPDDADFAPDSDTEMTWPEEVADPWPATAETTAPAPAASDTFDTRLVAPGSPVVLDLAGLAASGQALELVIEPNADGHGVRLRFGSPAGDDSASVNVVRDEVAPMPEPGEFGVFADDESAEWDVSDVATDTGDSPTLTSGAPSDETPSPEPAAVDVPFLAGVAPTEEPAPGTADPQIEMPFVNGDRSTAYVDAPQPAFALDDEETSAAFESNATATAVMDDDDPARILADIRARLAALDARR